MKQTFNAFVALLFTLSTVHAFAASRGGEELDPTDGTPASQNNALNEKAQAVQNNHGKSSSKISSYIHQQLLEDSSLSKNAQNVKISTNSKTITLTGMVDSADEKTKVEAIAKKIASNDRVLKSKLQVKVD